MSGLLGLGKIDVDLISALSAWEVRVEQFLKSFSGILFRIQAHESVKLHKLLILLNSHRFDLSVKLEGSVDILSDLLLIPIVREASHVKVALGLKTSFGSRHEDGD